MAVEITSSSMLKPSYSSPHPLTGEKIPRTIFDRANFDVFIPIVFAFHAPTPTNEALKEGLLKAVAAFPHLAGRMFVDDQRRRCFHLNNAGVLVIEASVSADLADVDALANIGDLYPAPPEENTGVAVFQVKLNRYKCGGLVIGVSIHHQAADGQSVSTFLNVWASTVRASPDFTLPSPFLDRAATAVPRDIPTPVFDHQSIEFKAGHDYSKAHTVVPMDKIKNLTVHFTAEFISNLKARVGVRCSTFECLLAHVWKKITAARDLKQEEFTQVRVAVNCRGRAKPPVPMDFSGNMVLWAFPKLQVRDLLCSSYSGVVAVIRDAVARIDEEYIKSLVDFGKLADEKGEELAATAAPPGTMLCPDLEVDSWLGLGFHKLDFGNGPPCAFLPPNLPIEGLMIFAPSSTAKGAVNLFMAVLEDHVEVFEKICYSLDARMHSCI